MQEQENKKEQGYWYNEFVGKVFLVKNDSKNKKRYVLVDGCAWIDKVDSERVEVETWQPV